MGLFWDLLQQSQLHSQASAAETLEERVATLETQLAETQQLQRKLLEVLEKHFEADLDGGGRVG